MVILNDITMIRIIDIAVQMAQATDFLVLH